MTEFLQSQAQIVPDSDESQERYIIRAHEALRPEIPDVDERNRTVWSLWSKYRGPTLAEQRASKAFNDQSRYMQVPGQAVFVEHDTVKSSGDPVSFGLKDLCEILRTCNRRIADRDLFAAISLNHTSADPNDPDPEVLGFAGPYRLGQIGNVKPLWAIFCDEHWYAENKDRLQKMPRRSPELITYPHNGQRFFDPIAALGSKSPRLHMPIRYSTFTNEDGHECERYEAGAAGSYPGGSNTYIKGSQDFKVKQPLNEQYESKEQPMQGSNEMIAQLVEAFAQTPEIQFIRSMMQEQANEERESLMSEQEVGMEEPLEEDLGIEEPVDEMPLDEPEQNMADMTGDASGEELVNASAEDELYAAECDKKDPEKFGVDDADDMSDLKGMLPEEEGIEMYSNQKSGASVERYEALQNSHNALVEKYGAMNSELETIKRERTDLSRTQSLTDLANKYPGIVDLDEEKQTMLYSAGAKVSDSEFKKHVETIERYAARTYVPTANIPNGSIPTVKPQTERYSADVCAKAVEIHTAAVDRGEMLTWDQSIEKALGN
tara:strand:+ start:2373 stop:4013 length:1641 start_codon:yes stop_codon:yes gene_type:complete